MTLNEFYAAVGGSLDEVMGRLAKEERILKYLTKFTDNTDYDELVDTLETENYEEAFRHVHNLKGVAANLGLGALYESSHILCEELRPGKKPETDISEMLAKVKADNEKAKNAIKEL